MKLLQTLTLQSNFDEVERLEGFLNALQEELGFSDEIYAKMMLAVSEAATNSIVHGNKLDESKMVEVSAHLEDETLYIHSQDQGEGFDPATLPDPLAEENLMKTSGRGVFLMKEYADDVSFSENGTKLTLVFNLPG
ncbi:ATP-binding protein [Gracilimonas sp.]|uniref:ATP-binding protein n=1 Tax=Gracilimonas sp. TaxID=1974203 RepID=UPI0028727154|nr:ATP-binding protein [Gracilimonas sp.]